MCGYSVHMWYYSDIETSSTLVTAVVFKQNTLFSKRVFSTRPQLTSTILRTNTKLKREWIGVWKNKWNTVKLSTIWYFHGTGFVVCIDHKCLILNHFAAFYSVVNFVVMYWSHECYFCTLSVLLGLRMKLGMSCDQNNTRLLGIISSFKVWLGLGYNFNWKTFFNYFNISMKPNLMWTKQ